jgi:hypothetical protein
VTKSRSGRILPILLAGLLLTAAAAPADAAHLTYYGGPVLTHVKIVQVLWGTGTFTSGVSDGGVTTTTKLGDFYKAVTNSRYLDWLRQYATPSQAIGRGTFAGTYAITPSVCSPKPCTVSDGEIQSELKAQITAGHLPAPDANTVYCVSFPKDVTITWQGFFSCVQFCAYHGTASYGTPTYLYYAVLPYVGVGGACSGMCGSGDDYTVQTTVAASHLLNSITDPASGVAVSLAAPLAWFDGSAGEIGGICNGQQATIVGPDAVTYTVQKGWSNAANACVAVSLYALGDADGNGILGVGDVFWLINSLFAGGPPPLGAADVNTDNVTNVADVFYLINFLFAGGAAPF